MRVITFSRYFPAYHPRKGEPTFFVEKILNGIAAKRECGIVELDLIPDEVQKYINDFFLLCSSEEIKSHTIRAGKRWKVGDKFSPRIWSDKPYRSKQIEFAPPIEIKKVWDFEMDLNGVYAINGKYLLYDFLVEEPDEEILLAKNDGLEPDDFFSWFMPNYNKPKEFSGQIICWNENIEYA